MVAAGVLQPDDCRQGDGLLGGLTGGVCQVVDDVTDVVDGLTGDSLSPVTESVDDTADRTLGGVGEVLPTRKPAPGATTPPSATASPRSTATQRPGKGGGLLPTVLSTCLPLVASPECGAEEDASPGDRPRPFASPGPSQSAGSAKGRERSTSDRDRRRDGVAVAVSPAEPPHRPETRVHTTEVSDPVLPEPAVVDIEAPRLEPLWPGALVEELQRRMPGRQTVAATRRSDPLGTALTTALLVAAILAVRMMYGKRGAEESIPLEPVRVGRHRTA
ncbi:hypothetical protein GCM10010156_13500 [Planobispora rosea]|uniref:Uncharacterized protein n=2 Tax=Planobispora rosea TaxID=35762 RepID=A0A8J3S4U3_PLARO|nr:hypothetical protein GCM10010156_13500 [Planobispora rosea]GIH83578.1 hypothetical protein Pro02_19860 [Planobispora rosea]